MSFTEKYLPVSRNKHFAFFATGSGAIAESFAPGFAFEIQDIRFTLSIAHISEVDLVGRLSCGQGSAYNYLFMSARASALTDPTQYVWTPSTDRMYYQHNDELVFTMGNSAGTFWGIVVSGWAVTT